MKAEELYAATCMVLSDWPTETVDAIFFHARANGDHDNLFESAHYMVAMNLADFIAINGFDGVQNAPGKDFYLENLDIFDVKRSHIVLSEPVLNTKTENDAFVKLARERNWKSAVILTQPHQVLRAFLGAIGSMQKLNYLIRLYAIVPSQTLWFKNVFGSQGAENKERFEHVFDELERIPKYQEKGDLCSFQEFFGYMRNRDKIP